jgi:hypothetical protein
MDVLFKEPDPSDERPLMLWEEETASQDDLTAFEGNFESYDLAEDLSRLDLTNGIPDDLFITEDADPVSQEQEMELLALGEAGAALSNQWNAVDEQVLKGSIESLKTRQDLLIPQDCEDDDARSQKRDLFFKVLEGAFKADWLKDDAFRNKCKKKHDEFKQETMTLIKEHAAEWATEGREHLFQPEL